MGNAEISEFISFAFVYIYRFDCAGNLRMVVSFPVCVYDMELEASFPIHMTYELEASFPIHLLHYMCV